MKTRIYKLLALLAIPVMAVLTAPAQAGGSISIPLPPIPQIKLPAPPLMVWLPTPAVHVALDSPYPIFAHNDRYYLHSNNTWYVGPGYAGPWTFVHVHLLPPGLHHYHNHGWDYYQHQARYWQHHHHRAHPHFYGHHRVEHFESRLPLSQRDHHPLRHEPRHQFDSRQSKHEHNARQSDRDHARLKHSERARAPERAQFNGHHRGHETTRANSYSNDRGHGNKHWRMSY